MDQVSRHGEMLYEMVTKMFIMNNTIQDIMWSIDFSYDMNLMYCITSKLESSEFTHHYMPLGEMWTPYMNM